MRETLFIDETLSDSRQGERLGQALEPAAAARLRRTQVLVQVLTVLGVAMALGGAAVMAWNRDPLWTGLLVGIGGGLLLGAAGVLFTLCHCPTCQGTLGAQRTRFCPHCGIRLHLADEGDASD